MPLSDETLEVQLVNVVEIESDPARGVKGHVRIEFGNGSPTGAWEQAAFVKRAPLTPQTAIAVGEALVEAGKNLDKPELAVVGGMDAAEAEAKAQEALRAVPDPT